MAITLTELVILLGGDSSPLERDLADATGKTNTWASALGKGVTSLVGGAIVGGVAAVGAAIAAVGVAAFDVSAQTDAAARQMAASLGIPIDEAERFAEVAKRVYGNNFAADVTDAAAAIELLAKNISSIAGDDNALQAAAEDAFALRDVFGVDVADSISAAQTLMENFGLSSEEAFDLIAAGYQSGLDRSGDFLDTVNEYSTQFSEGGASAEEFFSLLESGLAGGALGTDKAADAFKEFRLRINDGTTATNDAVTALLGTGAAADDFFAGLSDGSISGAEAFQTIVAALGEIEDPAQRLQLGTSLLGTQFEDLGDSAALGLSLASDSFADVSNATEALSERYGSFGDIASAIFRRAVVAVTPLTDKLLDLANAAMPSIIAAFDTLEENAGPAIDAIGDALSKVGEVIASIWSGDEFGEGIFANIEILDFLKNWFDTNLPLIRQLVENVISAMTQFWDEHGEIIMSVVNNALETIVTVFDTQLKTMLDLVTLALQILTGDWEGAMETIDGITSRIWDSIKTIVTNTMDTLKTVVSAGKDVIVSVFTNMGTSMKNALTNIDWRGIGSNVIESIKSGLNFDAFTQWFKDKLDSLTNLFPFSPPKDRSSPLTRLPDAGRGIITQLQEGIDSKPLNLGSVASNVIAEAGNIALQGAPLSRPTSATNGSNMITIAPVLNFYGPQDSESVRSGMNLGILQAVRAAGL